jgi:MFS family permease
MNSRAGRTRVVATLGTAQTLAWASSYYLPAVLAAPMAAELGLSASSVFALFSLALLVSATVGPAAGAAIDRHGGRPVLMGTSVLFAAGLVALALAQGLWGLAAGWLLMGVAMGAGLYEAAFASLVRLYGRDSRNAITGITLIAGFASTVGWPLSSLMLAESGWRGACLGWAALHLLLGLGLNASLPRVPVSAGLGGGVACTADDSSPTLPCQGREPGRQLRVGGPLNPALAPDSLLTPAEQRRAAWLLATMFALAWFISTAMAAHLPGLLQSGGVSLPVAVAVGALVGPAQVAGRLLEFGLLRRLHPLLSARLAALAHPLGAAALLLLGPAAAFAFALLHGAGNGILTIAKGTLPLALFGANAYGARQGLLMMPSRVAQAFAPWLFGLGLERWGMKMLYGSAALGLLAALALLALPYRAPPEPARPAPVAR